MLKPFMLTLQNMKKKEIAEVIVEKPFSMLVPKSRAIPTEKKPLVEEKSYVKKSESPFFYPKQKDSLFWCFFIIKSGFSAYEYPGTTCFSREKELKFEYIEMLRKFKAVLKMKKIKNLREDIENELANKERIGMKTFIALCVASNINIIFIHKRKCFEIIMEDDAPIYVVHQKEINNHAKYFLETDPTKDTLNIYRETYFKWESVDKPLKAPSAYKLEDLKILCEKVGIKEDGKKKTKKELYDSLLLSL